MTCTSISQCDKTLIILSAIRLIYVGSLPQRAEYPRSCVAHRTDAIGCDRTALHLHAQGKHKPGQAQAQGKHASRLMVNQEAGAGASTLALIRQGGGNCMLGFSFGLLVQSRQMWVNSSCFGRFHCLGVLIECGFKGQHSGKNCSCDARCSPDAKGPPSDVGLVNETRADKTRGHRIMFVMMESRRLRNKPTSTHPIQRTWAVAAALNEHYAHVHGYGFRLYRPERVPGTKDPGDCHLRGRVARAATW